MRSGKKIISVVCTIAVLALCSANMTYAWANLNQTALVILTDRSFPGGDSGGTPDIPVDDPVTPPKDDEDPSAPGNPNQPGSPDTPSDPDQPGDSGSNSTDSPSDGTQDGDASAPSGGSMDVKGDLTTGDTYDFIFYFMLMLISLMVAIILGVFLIILLIRELERRKRKKTRTKRS